ncbi:AAA family ATPase [Methanococcus maripaludis]|uniref:Putative ATPase n=1 Tax=Methanococcus maripaludis TaxID=39152 RepID=A0A7J9PLA8_METMI|nr:AAA family ATPase [Methanococcus maripaludis]MBA2864053.1 putative ATPase [Methanococcus maripaludis]
MKNEEIFEHDDNLLKKLTKGQFIIPKLIFNNFGPVNTGEITLKPLTILFGENNTGKTHVGYAIWEFFHDDSSSIYNNPLDGWNHVKTWINDEIVPEIMETTETTKFKNKFFTKKIILDEHSRLKLSKKSIQDLFNYEYGEEVGEVILPYEQIIAELEIPYGEIEDIFKTHLSSNNGSELESELDSLGTSISEDPNVNISDKLKNTKNVISLLESVLETVSKNKFFDTHSESEFGINYDLNGKLLSNCAYTFENKSEKILNINIRILPLKSEMNKDELKKAVSKSLSENIYGAIVNGITNMHESCCYIPAPKAGLSLLSKPTHSESLKNFLSLPKKNNKKIGSTLPEPMIEYMNFLNNIPSTESRDFTNTVEFLENFLLSGKIVKLENDEILYKSDNMKKGIPMSISSSLVVDSMPLIAFLKYGILKKNSLLVLEEPESHLHPQAQRILGRAIVKLINSGLNIVLITHSPYILQQINNNLKLHYLSKRGKTEELNEYLMAHGWGHDDEVLDPENVTAYIFEKSDIGSIIKPLEIYENEGISSETFIKPLEELYMETAELRDLLEEGD